MGVFKVIICIFTCSIQNVLKKEFGVKAGKGEFTFSLLTSFFALLFFVVTSDGLKFDVEILPYSALFALSYAIGTITIMIVVCRNAEKRFDKPLFKWLWQN